MRGLKSVVIWAGWLACIWVGLHGNEGLLMLAKVLAWMMVIAGVMSVHKEVRPKLKTKPSWLAYLSGVVTMGGGVWLSYEGHWITGSALIVSEMVFLQAYFGEEDS